MASGPNLFDDVCVGLRDLPLHPQRVGEVELVQVGVLQEVLGQRRRVTQALWEEPGGRSGYRGAKVSETDRAVRYEAVKCVDIRQPLLSERVCVTFTCSAEFMKQVLPKLVRPHTPGCPL